MHITIAQLVAGGIAPSAAGLFQPTLGQMLARFSIDTPQRAAAFLAQCHVESAGFTRLEENLRYTSTARLTQVWPSRFPTATAARPFIHNPQALANVVYAGRLGNGSQASGDGWRFRGRGLKQLTGRTNYRQAAQALGRPYLEQPDLVAQPHDALLTAAWFWHSHKLNPLADTGDIDSITRRVNGAAMLAAAERRRRTGQLLAVLG